MTPVLELHRVSHISAALLGNSVEAEHSTVSLKQRRVKGHPNKNRGRPVLCENIN